jgi:hypothetical protein
MGGAGRLEVGEAPDKWAPPVGERVREWRERKESGPQGEKWAAKAGWAGGVW